MSESSIYNAPESELYDSQNIDQERVSRIAYRQRTLMLLILVQLLLNPVVKALQIQNEGVIIFIGAVALVLLIWVAVAAVRLSLILNHIAVTVVLGLFALVPLLNLIVLLILSRQSTKVLKSSGIRVGLLGANLKDIAKINQ